MQILKPFSSTWEEITLCIKRVVAHNRCRLLLHVSQKKKNFFVTKCFYLLPTCLKIVLDIIMTMGKWGLLVLCTWAQIVQQCVTKKNTQHTLHTDALTLTNQHQTEDILGKYFTHIGTIDSLSSSLATVINGGSITPILTAIILFNCNTYSTDMSQLNIDISQTAFHCI